MKLRDEACVVPDVPAVMVVDRSHFQECVIDMMKEMFGQDSTGKLIKNNNLTVTVDETVAVINLETQVCMFTAAHSLVSYNWSDKATKWTRWSRWVTWLMCQHVTTAWIIGHDLNPWIVWPMVYYVQAVAIKLEYCSLQH